MSPSVCEGMSNRKMTLAAILLSLLAALLALLLLGSISGETVEMTAPVPLMPEALLAVSIGAGLFVLRLADKRGHR